MLPNRLTDRVRLLRRAFPLSLATLVILYQLGPARWVHDHVTDAAHFALEILFYGTAGPLLSYWALTRLEHWLVEKEQAEREARLTEGRLAAISAASADAILGLDPAGRIESWNRGAELLFGYAADEIRGRPLTELLSSGQAAGVEYQWLANAVREAGFVRGHETACRAAGDEVVMVDLTATLLTGEERQPSGMSVILRDVTERKRRESEIRRLNASLNEQIAARTRELAEKVEQLARANAELQELDRTRSEFVSLVSHQIRAPLTNIRGATERMRAGCSVLKTTCSRMLVIVDLQVARLGRLVQDVLSAARAEAGELVLHPEPISVLPAMGQIIEQIRTRTANRPFHLFAPPGLPLAFADRDRVAEVLANLCDNADKYAPGGTAVVLTARASETEVTLSVADSGPGIPPGELGRIFDKFRRADRGDAQAAYGYGLGLFVCRRLVQAMGGRIWAENAPGGGAVISFTLPVARS